MSTYDDYVKLKEGISCLSTGQIVDRIRELRDEKLITEQRLDMMYNELINRQRVKSEEKTQ